MLFYIWLSCQYSNSFYNLLLCICIVFVFRYHFINIDYKLWMCSIEFVFLVVDVPLTFTSLTFVLFNMYICRVIWYVCLYMYAYVHIFIGYNTQSFFSSWRKVEKASNVIHKIRAWKNSLLKKQNSEVWNYSRMSSLHFKSK